MSTDEARRTTTIPAPGELPDRYRSDGWAHLSDADLIAAAAGVLNVPRRNPADSFVLHAPLELVARSALLAHVPRQHRDVARMRILSVAAGVQAWGDPVDKLPAHLVTADRFDSTAEGARWLGAAIDDGDLDEVDGAAAWLGRAAGPQELRSLLAGIMVPRLSAAAHGSIFLYQLPRVSPRCPISGELVRSLVREVARFPDWRIGWVDRADPTSSSDEQAGTLARLLGAVTDQGRGGSDFIQPTMDRVDGVAESMLGPLRLGPGSGLHRAILRTAARSMLQDRSDAAPYGWSHCLTLPQAVLGLESALERPELATRIAATYVLGFRASSGDVEVEVDEVPEDPGVSLDDALRAGPHQAAGAMWHSTADRAELVSTLASRASAAHDAHLVKYTLACIDAASADPAAADLYLSAAAYLCGWWAVHDDPGDPFIG